GASGSAGSSSAVPRRSSGSPGRCAVPGWDCAEQQRHRPRGRNFGQRDDAQEELLPFQPALLHLPEHVATDRAVLGAVYAVVFFLLHGEVGPQHLLERVLLRRLAEGVVSPVLRDRLVVLGLPGQLLDLLVCPGHTLATHRHPFLGGFRGLGTFAPSRSWGP